MQKPPKLNLGTEHIIYMSKGDY